ncbi:MAG: hypothetical protein ABIY52_08185 [Gemmatimonadaceae bacterium]
MAARASTRTKCHVWATHDGLTYAAADEPGRRSPLADDHQAGMKQRCILVVTGASGAGKTATVRALAQQGLADVACFEFDAIGVPTTDAMEREYGSGEAWQSAMTHAWLERLWHASDAPRVSVLDAQTRPSVVIASAAALGARVRLVLFECSPPVRAARLRGARQQPELDTDRMTAWAAYLRAEAVRLELPIVDTSALTIPDAVEQLKAEVAALRDRAPAP